jgi:hypothetical protein
VAVVVSMRAAVRMLAEGRLIRAFLVCCSADAWRNAALLPISHTVCHRFARHD